MNRFISQTVNVWVDFATFSRFKSKRKKKSKEKKKEERQIFVFETVCW